MTAARLALAPLALLGFFWGRRLSRRLAALERHSRLDPLTGLGSGSWLDSQRWPAALRSGRPLAVAFIDLDHLKQRNDTFGHGAGDEYIRTGAQAICGALRRGVDEIFRLHTAGDEFLVLLHGPLDPDGFATALHQRLRQARVSASIGLAYCPVVDFGPARAQLRMRAWQACRQAKSQGGDCAVVLPAQARTPSSAERNP